MKTKLINFASAISGSYGQVFFSDNRLFAIFLVAASFTDAYIGVSGFIGVLFSILLAYAVGLNPAYVNNGTYSFNSLLTGLALGAYFKITGNFMIILLISSMFSLIITGWLSSITSRFKLPFLSLPFIITVWIVLLNARSFSSGVLEPRTVESNVLWHDAINQLSNHFPNLHPLKLLLVYLKSMAAIFFQNNIIAGIMIVVGLVLYSRIALLLSLVGFFSGFCYLNFTQANTGALSYQLTASSYILSALGLGGFFLIASGRSFLLVIFSAPIIGLLAHAMDKILFPFALPLFSLPFSFGVIIILSFIHNIYSPKIFKLVQLQRFSPEKNLYAYHTFMERFKKETDTIIHLPFFGEWTVSQGHEGNMTHKKEWRFAWDFVVKDEHKRTFKLPGKTVTDFYCYGLPVLAVADGQVTTVEDGIDDNAIGNENLVQNWGNTVIIKHNDYLYSKLSHLKKGSFKVKEGDFVKKGEILALCGNSGRSPEPHIHFQLQASDKVGATTIKYPISYYGRKIYDSYQFNFFDVPSENETLVRPVATPLLKKAFNLIPGMKFHFVVDEENKTHDEHWEVMTDATNNSYILCKITGAVAYFKYDDTLFYFTGFSGNIKSLLYYFYLGAYKVLLSQFKNLKISDQLSIEGTHKGIIKTLQDFLAPFYIFLKPNYSAFIADADKVHAGTALKIVSKVRSNIFGKKVDFEIEIGENRILEIKITEGNKCITAKQL